MKIYLELPEESRGIGRVYTALAARLPEGWELTKDSMEADHIVLHIVGRHDQNLRKAQWCKKYNIPYSVIQYCLRSTKNPNTADWFEIWKDARTVWSYYDLRQALADDGHELEKTPNFYLAPLGVDTKVFKDRNKTGSCKVCGEVYDNHIDKKHDFFPSRKYSILASSQHALSESARECVLASQEVGREMVFLGHELRRGSDVVCISGISDIELSDLYSHCEFVSGLRRIEGFELPAIEGLMCGARPVFFDKPHYRLWFDGIAEFIPEGTREEVVESLKQLFLKGTLPVSSGEKAFAKQLFNWDTIVEGFWKKSQLI